MLKIQKKRIRSLKKYASLLHGRQIVLAVDLQSNKGAAHKAGFSPSLSQGEVLLPAVVGSVTRYNAFGKELVRKDLPMETHYRQVEWEWHQWSGYHQTEVRREVKDVPYEKYPRDVVAPPGLELMIAKDKIISPIYKFPTDKTAILHAMNVFLEIFGECEIVGKNLESLIQVPAVPLNWKVLPAGEMPWPTLRKHLDPIFRKAKLQDRLVFEDRLTTIEAYKPDFRAFGMGGYEGYVVFGFKTRGIYLCESIHHGNAIYVFDENWEEFSKKTKAEVIQQGLMKERIVHYGTWQKRIRELLKGNQPLINSAVQQPRSINSSSNKPTQSVVV